ncbi:unnamed protein product [Rangifer tarandus platyrhynchus]|uniref:Uncharacterized protein n=1 Tax=Rangifer tarandus platyrhynchus TaxID=3082113 RepID=A0ABN8Z5J1_RANTA|nr:unnamed protein product [Rangifer tarandus platyrhynchus]
MLASSVPGDEAGQRGPQLEHARHCSLQDVEGFPSAGLGLMPITHISEAPPGGEGLSGAGGLLGEALGAPPRHLSLGTTMPDGAGRAWSVEPEGSRDAAGTRTPAQQCQACHHQRLLLFPAHFLTDSKVKSKTWTRPSRVQEKKHLRRLHAPHPPRLTPCRTPLSQAQPGDTRPLGFTQMCLLLCCATQPREHVTSDGQTHPRVTVLMLLGQCQR